MLFQSGPLVDLPASQSTWGVRTPYGILLPPGGKVAAFVRSTGTQSNDDQFIRNNLVATVNAGCAKCRSGLGDTVIVLPGHTENITSATALSSLVADSNIVGVGRGSSMPTVRWTNAAAQWALNKANVSIQGMRLRLEGADNITKAILVTGTDNAIVDCDIEVSSGASNDSAIAIEIGSGATRFRMLRCYVRGTTAVTDGIKIVAALDGVEIGFCRMMFAATEVDGLVHVTAAATNLWFHDNSMANIVASSTACIVVDDVAATGLFERNSYSTLNNGTASSQGAIFGTSVLVRSVQCFSCDEPKKSGILTPTAAT